MATINHSDLDGHLTMRTVDGNMLKCVIVSGTINAGPTWSFYDCPGDIIFTDGTCQVSGSALRFPPQYQGHTIKSSGFYYDYYITNNSITFRFAPDSNDKFDGGVARMAVWYMDN